MVLIEAINDCNRSAADVSALLRNQPDLLLECSYTTSYSCLHYLAYNNDCRKTSALLDCINDEHRLRQLFRRVSSKKQTFLHVAGNEASIDFLRLCYSRQQALVAGMINDQDCFGHTAISLAAGNNHSDCLELLLSFENAMESLTTLDKWGRLPIQIASQHGSSKAFEFLKTYYIDVLDDIDMTEGITEHGHVTAAKDQMSSLASELQAVLGARRSSAEGGTATAPQTATVERGIFAFAKPPPATSSSVSKRNTALSKCIEYPVDSDAVAAMIVGGGFDLGGRDMSGMTALHKLASYNNVPLAGLLLSRLSAEEANESRNPGQQTALHVAVEMGAFEACQLLAADPRVDRRKVDKQGRTPRQLAGHLGYHSFAEIL